VISASSFSLPTATAIRAAADRLRPGDVLLLEVHRPGPRATGTGQQGFIAVKWWPDDLLAVRYATGKSVVVVEAAGNGAENGGPTPSGAACSTPVPSSSAPAFPPPGTRGADWGPQRSRLDSRAATAGPPGRPVGSPSAPGAALLRAGGGSAESDDVQNGQVPSPVDEADDGQLDGGGDAHVSALWVVAGHSGSLRRAPMNLQPPDLLGYFAHVSNVCKHR
jgi:hypothetical protein